MTPGPVLHIRDLARLEGVTEATARARLHREGGPPFYRRGRALLVLTAEYVRWAERETAEHTGIREAEHEAMLARVRECVGAPAGVRGRRTA